MYEWELSTMAGRQVAIRRLTPEQAEYQECMDCFQQAVFEVQELGDCIPVGQEGTNWTWCGHCDIGG